MKHIFSFVLALMVSVGVSGKGKGFAIVDGDKVPRVVVSDNDWPGVKRAAKDLRSDIGMVAAAKVTTERDEARIIVGTIGRSAMIDSLISNGVLDVKVICGQWESYVIEPVDGNLVVAGSDRRGTIYGVYEVSKRIGVSPWTWWADVPVERQKSVVWSDGRLVAGSPKVKYRGIFLNDEDWGLKPWASTNYEKELGDVGPRTYERIFELVLRLGGNMVAPAMHSCTGAFYTHPESKVVADEMGVIITTSHCEPMLFNNASKVEWDGKRDGEWNYRLNRSTILGKFANRVAEAHEFDNIYTVAMRGVHDEGLRGPASPQERVSILTDVIKDQRQLLELFDQRPANEIPQIFVPYKETMDVYQAGLKVPDDITLVWPDDNYGYMKRLSNPDEQKRGGRAGVYYHLSYLGTPHDYLWVCTTAPALMYEELKKAYDTGADRYWLLNVGDIKPMEMAVQMYFDFARDVDAFDYDRINTYQADMLATLFGSQYKKDFQQMLDTYYRLAWSRKPEFMGWEWEWDSKDRARLRDTEFSFAHYNDAQQRLADYHALAHRAKTLMQQLPEAKRTAFFELFGYAAMASEQMNRKFLMAQLNHELHAAGNAAQANWAADASVAARDSIDALTHTYNTMLNGKWSGMMELAPGLCALYQNMPELQRTEGVAPVAPNLNVDKRKNVLEGCAVVDLVKPTKLAGAKVINGLGYDWHVVQLGEALSKGQAYAEYGFDTPAEQVTLHIHALPFFPIYEGHSNRFSLSIDGAEATVLENKFTEWSTPWKEQVLQNGKEFVVTLPVDKSCKHHTLRLSSVDNGQMIERIVIDWGGLKPSYLGPSSANCK